MHLSFGAKGSMYLNAISFAAKEMGAQSRNSLLILKRTDHSTPVSQSRHTLRFQPIACRSIMRCPRVLTRPEMFWQAFVPNIASGQLAVFDKAENNNNRKTEFMAV